MKTGATLVVLDREKVEDIWLYCVCVCARAREEWRR